MRSTESDATRELMRAVHLVDQQTRTLNAENKQKIIRDLQVKPAHLTQLVKKAVEGVIVQDKSFTVIKGRRLQIQLCEKKLDEGEIDDEEEEDEQETQDQLKPTQDQSQRRTTTSEASAKK